MVDASSPTGLCMAWLLSTLITLGWHNSPIPLATEVGNGLHAEPGHFGIKKKDGDSG